MPESLHLRRYSHMNLVLEDYDASLNHFKNLFGAVMLLDMPQPVWHAYLVDIGGAVLEIFIPKSFILNSRHGPHHLGLEFEADVQDGRTVMAAHNIRIMRDIVDAIHTDPMDGFGVDYEIYGGSFYENAPFLLTQVKPPAYWRDQHLLGLMGIAGYTPAVSDIAQATRFAQTVFGATVIYEQDRPELAARAVGLQMAEIICELITPTGDGPLRRELEQSGQGIRSTVFRTRDIGQVRQYFAHRNIALIPGTAPGSLALPPAANLGIRFEFAE